MLETVKMHPLLVTASKDSETTTSRLDFDFSFQAKNFVNCKQYFLLYVGGKPWSIMMLL